MEVHIGKSHTDNFECGIWKQKVGNIGPHLKTWRCYKRETKISEIKAHVEKEAHNSKSNNFNSPIENKKKLQKLS